MTKFVCFFALILSIMVFEVHARPVTVLVPSSPTVEKSVIPAKKDAKNSESQPEVDLLISRMTPFEYAGHDMEMPQLFAEIRYYQDQDGKLQSERRDLLGDIEEIRYLNQRAWGANLALGKGGLYQYILEGRPVWNEQANSFVQEEAKALLPVFGAIDGWEQPAGLAFEILPTTRPFGLVAPALFSGKVVLDGQPLANAPVYMERINSNNLPAANIWQQNMETRTDGTGHFHFVLNHPGWWACAAITEGAPLKGPDGQLKNVERASILWVYVGSSDDSIKK